MKKKKMQSPVGFEKSLKVSWGQVSQLKRFRESWNFEIYFIFCSSLIIRMVEL